MTQTEYIAIPFNDCGFDTLAQRKAFMTREFERPITFADELDSRERSQLITALKDIKEGQSESGRKYNEEEL